MRRAVDRPRRAGTDRSQSRSPFPTNPPKCAASAGRTIASSRCRRPAAGPLRRLPFIRSLRVIRREADASAHFPPHHIRDAPQRVIDVGVVGQALQDGEPHAGSGPQQQVRAGRLCARAGSAGAMASRCGRELVSVCPMWASPPSDTKHGFNSLSSRRPSCAAFCGVGSVAGRALRAWIEPASKRWAASHARTERSGCSRAYASNSVSNSAPSDCSRTGCVS